MKAIKANNFVAINKDEIQFDLLLIFGIEMLILYLVILKKFIK